MNSSSGMIPSGTRNSFGMTVLEDNMRQNLIDEENEMDMEWRGTVNRWNKDVKQMENDQLVVEYTDLELEKV